MADTIFNVKSGFYNAINNDRRYFAEDMTRPYKRIVANGVFATPQGTASTDLQVLSANSGMNIVIKAGQGIFHDRWFENENDISMSVPSNTGIVPRRDSVIVQIDMRDSGRIGSIVYRTGTPAANPQPPAIGTVDGVYEWRIANIYVASSASYIGQDAIVDLRGSGECPWVTSLIHQVDTSTLYAQWQAAYQNYYNQETERFNTFMRTLTEELSVNTNVLILESSFETTVTTTQVPINIAGFDKQTDALMVYINGLLAVEGTRYTVSSDSTYITLTPSIAGGQKVDFICFKAVVDADEVTAMQLMTTINNKLSEITSDSGWINFWLEGGATAFDENSTPAVRKYGNCTNMRGAIKGVTTTGTTVCTLPSAYRPSMNHVFTSCAMNGATVNATVTFQVLTTGEVKLFAKNGTIGATDMIPIATNFIVG